MFDIFYWSAVVANIVIHLKSIALYIFIFEIDLNIFFNYNFIYLFIDFYLKKLRNKKVGYSVH